jgi:hypothetical protein
LKFVSDFLNDPVPNESLWLSRYFRDGLGYEFLRYFLIFRSSVHFSEHVGLPCSKRWRNRMKSRFNRLERAHSDAKREMDFEKLASIEMGEFKLG